MCPEYEKELSDRRQNSGFKVSRKGKKVEKFIKYTPFEYWEDSTSNIAELLIRVGFRKIYMERSA